MQISDLKLNIRVLKKIQPSSEWKDFARQDILARISFSSENSPLEQNRWAEFSYLGRSYWQMAQNFFRQPIGTLLLVLLLVAGGGVLKVKTDSSLPGDWLYPLKRGTEKLQVALIFNPRQKSIVRLELADRRIQELNEVISSEEADPYRIKEAIDNFRADFTPLNQELAFSQASNLFLVEKVENKTQEFQQVLSQVSQKGNPTVKKDAQKALQEVKQVKEKALVALKKDHKQTSAVEEKEEKKEHLEKALAKLNKAQQALQEKNYYAALQNVRATDALLKMLSCSSTNATSSATSSKEAIKKVIKDRSCQASSTASTTKALK